MSGTAALQRKCEFPMNHFTYKIVPHDGGYAYTVDGVFSEPFATHDAAVAAARRASLAAPRRSNMKPPTANGIPRPPPATIAQTPRSRTAGNIPADQAVISH